MHNSFRLNADHFQFYLEDCTIAHDTSLLWTAAFLDGQLDVLDGLIAIGIARYGQDTAVTIEHQELPPPTGDFEMWDVVAEASIRTVSGELRLTTPEGDDTQAPILPTLPGSYRVRIYYGHLYNIMDELAPHGPDTYRLIIWPSEPSEPQILKAEEPPSYS